MRALGSLPRSRAAAVIRHHPQRVGPARAEIVRIPIEAALDHVRNARHPVDLVRVVVGEDLVVCVHGGVEVVARAGREDLKLGRIGPHAEDSTSEELELASVGPDGALRRFGTGSRPDYDKHRV